MSTTAPEATTETTTERVTVRARRPTWMRRRDRHEVRGSRANRRHYAVRASLEGWR